MYNIKTNYPLNSKPIVIIDDDARNLRFVEAVLSRHYKTHAFQSPQNALDILKTGLQPCLILCDVFMAEMSGDDFLASLRQDSDLALIPFIFLSTQADQADIRSTMMRRADDYLLKPIAQQDLLTAIEKRLRRHQDVHSAHNVVEVLRS